MRCRVTRLLLAVLLAALAGCATTGEERDPRDPFEALQPRVYRFNDGFDESSRKPVASAYRDGVPRRSAPRVGNFFANLDDLLIGVNNLLQGKFEDGVNDWARFVFNSTFGLLGMHDVATDMGTARSTTRTSARPSAAGASPPGPYLLLPSSARAPCATASALRSTRTPRRSANAADQRCATRCTALYLVNTRADLLDASRLLEEAALDHYVFLRDAYLQRRRSLIYDGSPPREKLE